MDSDLPLKILFQTRARDLLPLTGDAGARVLSARVLELSAAKRSVDLVLLLVRKGERYARHVEFQTHHRGNLALRCFDYASRLVFQLKVPVLTTVVYVKPPAPRELAWREVLSGELVHERRFDVVRLWELDPREALGLGPGGAALVGLSKGADLGVIGRASLEIRRHAPLAQRADLLAILQVFSEGQYTAMQLARVIPEEVVMASGLFEKAIAKGKAEGRVEGRVEGQVLEARQLCAELVKRHHPREAVRLLPAIDACSDVMRLRRSALRASEVSADELLRLVGPSRSRRAAVGRASRPQRRSGRAAAR